jgi:diguanylate cyclase (GGDEF)-like protein/PAS domain S-box-containing protein
VNQAFVMTDTHAIPRLEQRATPMGRLLREWGATAGGRVALGAIAFFVIYAAWLLGSGASEHRVLLADLWNLPMSGAAGIAAWFTSRTSGLEPRLRRAWLLCALAFLCDMLGNTWWLISENVFGVTPIASLADVVYLAYYPLLFAGLMSFPTMSRTRSEALKLTLDVGTVLLSGVAAIWFYLLAPALGDPATTPLETTLTIAYPIGDIVLLFGSAFALFHRPSPAGRHALAMLAFSGLVVFFTDLLYGHMVLRDGDYLSGNPVDLGWQLAALLWFLSAQYQRFSIGRLQSDASYAPQLMGVSLLPYFAVAAGFGMLVKAASPVWSLSVGLGVGTVFFLTLIVVVRQVLAVRETARLVAERSAREARFRSMVQHSSDVISILDPSGTLQFVSPAVGRVFRWSAESLVGKDITSVIHPDDVASARAFLRGVAQTPGRTASFVCRLLDGDGKWRHVETMCTSLLDDPTVAGLVLNTRDVSDRTRLEAELTRRAFNDPLTGLANRARFNSLVDEALRRPQRRSAHIAVIYLDLDNFKTINDSLGHLQGDQLLIEFAARLLNATRGCDTVSRLGGDEFAVLLEGMSREEDALPVAERITSAMQKPFRLGSAEVVVGASIGIAHAMPGTTAEVLLRDADVAMYVAKRDGKGRYTVFQPQMQHAVRNSQELESDLRAAIDREEFTLLYQPVVDLRDGRIVGAEALLRWDHPVRGRLSPLAFLHTAVESGLIVPIGRIVLQTACAQLAKWRRQHPELSELALSVNVAGRQFQADSFPIQVAAAIEATGVPANRLVLEVTESEIMKDTHLTLTRLHTLKALGVSIAIDDFGTGYSSLAYLQRFPVDVLKIDKSFVDQMAFAGHGQSLAKMIIGLGETLGIRTVAEGIQDAEQATALRDMRCEFGQGYYFSAAVEPDELVRRVLAGSVWSAADAARREERPGLTAAIDDELRHRLQGAA